MPADLTPDTFAPFRISILEELHAAEAEKRAEAAERALDPISDVTWDTYRGQPAVKSELLIRIHSALHRGARMPHVLLTGGPGTGKTTVARLIAMELGRPFLAITHPPRSAAALGDAMWGYEQGVVLLDEIHQFGKPLVHAVMQLTEEGRIQASGSTYELPEVTVVAATTEKAMLFRPLVSRFGCAPQFVDYTDEDIARMVADMLQRCDIPISRDEGEHPNVDDGVALAVAASGNPRTARHLVEAVRDLHVTGMPADAASVLRFVGLSEDGLSRDHLAYLSVLAAATGGRAGLPALATMLGMATEQVRQLEAVLTRRRFITYTPAGRQITTAGRGRVRAT